jgi:hypothetical protein
MQRTHNNGPQDWRGLLGICGSHGGDCVEGCGITPCGRQIPKFRKNLLPSSTLKMEQQFPPKPNHTASHPRRCHLNPSAGFRGHSLWERVWSNTIHQTGPTTDVLRMSYMAHVTHRDKQRKHISRPLSHRSYAVNFTDLKLEPVCISESGPLISSLWEIYKGCSSET